MNQIQRNPIRLSITLGAILLSSALLGACFGGGGSSGDSDTTAGIGGTGIVFGRITGFGSVWVNGRRFDIDGSEIIVDGESGTQNDLKLGMVVKLDVETENGRFAGVAGRVEFDDVIEGPVNGVPMEVGSGVKELVILDQTVTIDATRTLFEGTGYGTIMDGDVVEVSGFRTKADKIVATYVRKVGHISNPPIEVELRGQVDTVIPNVSFKINDVLINYPGAITQGMFVEVEGTFVTHLEVNAVEVEQEDEDFGDNVDDISLHGVVSQYNPPPADGLAKFFVNGQLVDASTAELEPADLESLMQNGLEVEVEGEIVDGVLIAEELELSADSELRTTVFSVDTGSNSFVVEYPGLGTVLVNTSAQTLFEDDTAAAVPNFSLDDLDPGDFVEVEGVKIGNAVSAHTVERRDPNDSKLQGTVEAFDPEVSITILGITYPMDAAAVYQEDPTMTAAQFFHPSNLKIGDIVELEDNDPADGLADEAEIDD